MKEKERLNLFMETFKGRPDIVARHFHSKKSGIKGYAPICRNKWKKSVCQLRRDVNGGGCYDCSSCDYVPVFEALVERHINNGPNNVILAIYPLLKDNTCNFIAGDFDNHNNNYDPLPDVKALYEVCEVNEIPIYILRSKSGNGYHTYIFFKEPVPAWKARLVKLALLEEAQVVGNDASFDRLFPNQDKRSGKGFGNPIALPFQGKASESGHTLFLRQDTGFKDPYTDQWRILKNIKKIDEAKLDEIISDWSLKQKKSSNKQEISETINSEKFPPADYDRVLKCKFVKHCHDDAESLSEPDWYIWVSVAARCENGEEIVHNISKHYPRYNQVETEKKIKHALTNTGPYLCKTIEKINDQHCRNCEYQYLIKSPIVLGHDNSNILRSPLVEKDGGLYKITKFKKDGNHEYAQITSFIINPIESITMSDEGEFLNVILKNGLIEKSITFPADCWNSLPKFLKTLPSKEFIFRGIFRDVQLLRGHCASLKMPHRKGVRTAGFHGGYFVTEDGAINKDGPTSDLVFMNNVKSNCRLIKKDPVQNQDFSLLKSFNIQQVVMPVLGFITACFFKPTINSHFGGFPLLGIFGEAGAGKTSTITRVVMRFWAIGGMPHSISEQSKFSLMKLTDASNAIPLCLEENKACTQNPKQRTVVSDFVRASYNALEGQRGRPDQSIVNYRYQAPVVIAGETGFVESAILDRLVIVEMSKIDSAPYHDDFVNLKNLPLEQAGRAILERALLTKKSQVKKDLDQELKKVSSKLMDRPRTNAAVCRFGLRILSEVLGLSFNDKEFNKIDSAIFNGISDDGKERKSAVDMILEKMGVMAGPKIGPIDSWSPDFLENGIHYQVEADETRTSLHLRLHVAVAYPKFKRWARIHDFDGDILPENDFKKQLKKEKYFIANEAPRRKRAGYQRG